MEIFMILVIFVLISIIIYLSIKNNDLKKLLEKKDSRFTKIMKMTDKYQTQLMNLNTQYEEAKLNAQNANLAKSDFLAKMSHEIRTPMNAILGMLYLTQKTELNLMQDSYISKANSAAKSLLAIINDILDFSKIEAGKLSLEYKEFNFNSMIHETMEIMSFNAQGKGVELLAYYDSSIPEVIKSDKIRIEQILNNLISNAIKFTSDGEVVVSSKLIKKENNIATIMFSIKDSGIGISKDGQEKLFKDFSQVDDTITRKFGGTGLGLAITKKLSELLGGKVWIEESKQNIGSTFCFTIQCEIGQNISNTQYSFPAEMNNLNILIVDDNRISCDVLKKMFESFEFDVTVVHSGEDAYESILNSDKVYDLILLDYKMPKLNGIETYKKIKTIANITTPKTIMITAYSQDDILEQITEIGILNCLTKPVSPSILYETIVDVLNPNNIKNENMIKKSIIDQKNFDGVKILLAEDNELNQDFAKALLNSVNISVDIAKDGVEAVNLVKSKIYDAVLMDIQMPNMDGLTATKEIRCMQKDDIYFKDLPIIALSANALVGDRDISINAGMHEHVSKPIDPKELLETLDKIIKIKSLNKNISNNVVINKSKRKDSKTLKVDEALDRIGGNETIYNKLIHSFIKKYTNIYSDVINLINNNELILAEIKVHEVKGIAGNLGAIELFNVLTLIDKELKQEFVPNDELLKKFDSVQKETISLMQEYSYSEKTETKEFDKNKIKELLKFIRNNIEDDIMICEEKLLQLIPFFGETKYYEKSKLLQNYFDQFEIDDIIDIIDELLKEIDE